MERIPWVEACSATEPREPLGQPLQAKLTPCLWHGLPLILKCKDCMAGLRLVHGPKGGRERELHTSTGGKRARAVIDDRKLSQEGLDHH